MPTAAPWTFDAQARDAKPASRIRNTQRPRTEAHHPNLDGLDHRFGPDLCCEWCGDEWLDICRSRAQCEVGNPNPTRLRG